MKDIILASSSPRRKELLSKIVDSFDIIPSAVEETYPPSLDKFKVSLYLSDLKAHDVYTQHPKNIVIGVDTTVIINEQILGKPANKDDARRMLKMLSGNVHYVVTGVTVYSDEKYQINSISMVYFKKLSNEDIESYLSNDEYKDKAGSYAIQGLAKSFIDKIEGDYDSIVGLPTNELKALLNKINK